MKIRDKSKFRIFILDSESETRFGQHLITNISICHLIIDHENKTFNYDRKFVYDYCDEFPGPKCLMQKFGGITGFILDFLNGLFCSWIMGKSIN